MMLRLALGTIAAAALAAGGTSPAPAAPAPAAASADTRDVTNVGRASFRVITFRGKDRSVPPGVLPLSANVLLIGHVEVEVPPGVDFSFNEENEAVFHLAEGEPPHPWVLRVGRQKLVAGAKSRLVVPFPAVGPPRFESAPFAYWVSAPREFLDQAQDLGDPLDASPFR
jgi:hypothetical protein